MLEMISYVKIFQVIDKEGKNTVFVPNSPSPPYCLQPPTEKQTVRINRSKSKLTASTDLRTVKRKHGRPVATQKLHRIIIIIIIIIITPCKTTPFHYQVRSQLSRHPQHHISVHHHHRHHLHHHHETRDT